METRVSCCLIVLFCCCFVLQAKAQFGSDPALTMNPGLLGSEQVLESDCCSRGLWAFFCKRCWEECPVRPGVLEVLDDLLKNRVFGQDEAIDKIVEAFNSRGQINEKPLVMHFAGDNGVGKTHTALTLSEILFSVKSTISKFQKGVVYIQGHNYDSAVLESSLPTEGVVTSNKYGELIKSQLKKCPFSLIIIDELELFSANAMYSFLELLEDPIAKEAVFILISDLGKEGFTQNMKDPSKEIETLILRDMETKWNKDKNLRLSNQIQMVVPFIPMSIQTREGALQPPPPSVLSLIAHLIDQKIVKNPTVLFQSNNIEISRVVFPQHRDNLVDAFATEGTFEYICLMIYQSTLETPLYSKRNYRGIEQIFQQKVIHPLTRHFKQYVGTLHDKKWALNMYWNADKKEARYSVSQTL